MIFRLLTTFAILFALFTDVLRARAVETEKLAPALAVKLASGDEKEVDQALQTIRSLIESEPGQAASYLRETWTKPLLEAGRYDTVAELTQAAICASPAELSTVVMLQTTRVNALLKSGRAEEALANAKSLFNVTSSDGTEKALALIAECLSAARPKDSAIVLRLRDQQMAGSTTRPATGPSVPNIVREIKVDAKPYEPAIARFDAGRYLIQTNERGSLSAEANLLLLADRVVEAKALMIRMREITTDDQRYIADENVARAIKAEDGTIGRSNSWLLNPPQDAPLKNQ